MSLRCVIAFLIAGSLTGCEFVSSEQIQGADLARALPAFAALPPDARIGYAPAPGSRRVLPPVELNRIGAKYAIADVFESPVCFEWELHAVTPEQALEAMRKGLELPGAQFEIVRLNQAPAPRGELVFPKSGLSATALAEPQTKLLWKGYVRYNGAHKFDLWAEVKISALLPRVVAGAKLAPGVPIPADSLHLEIGPDSPLRSDLARSLEEVVGHIPRREIAPGAAVSRTTISQPFDVIRGESVEVQAVNGAAVIVTEALAEASGRRGDAILLRNPKSGKTFKGVIEAQGKVTVRTGTRAPNTRT